MKHFFSLVLLCCLVSGLSAQDISHEVITDTAYYKLKKKDKLIPVRRAKADVCMIISKQNNNIIEEKVNRVVTGNVVWHKFYKDGRPAGKWQYYDETGEVIRERNFEKLVYGNCDDGVEARDSPIFAKFGNGLVDVMNYLSNNIKYPPETSSAGVYGKVKINFEVDETGKAIVSHICGKGLDGYCDLVVWEIIETMPLWTPGTIDGEPVKTTFNLPVSFKLR